MSAHKYELMFIADPELDERGLKKLTEQYLELVTKEGVVPSRTPIFGDVASSLTRLTARPRGNYVVVNYTTTPEVSAEALDRVLNLNESVVRTKILRKDAK